jgi:hypothetical protein
MLGCWIQLTLVPAVWMPFGEVGYPFSFLYFLGVQKVLSPDLQNLAENFRMALRGYPGIGVGMAIFFYGAASMFLNKKMKV